MRTDATPPVRRATMTPSASATTSNSPLSISCTEAAPGRHRRRGDTGVTAIHSTSSNADGGSAGPSGPIVSPIR